MSRVIFPEWTETFKKWVGLLVLGAPVYLIALIAYGVTPEAIRIGYMPEQPVPYSHALHIGELGLDCRYCHNTVERSPHAAVPPTATCMNCHKAIHATGESASKLLPIREAYSDPAKTVDWVRVHDLPDYVFFNHSAHVNRGVGCESCHGRIDQMEIVYQAEALTMNWCLDCHDNPEPHLRPLENITEMGYFERIADQQSEIGRQIRESNNINPPTNCSTCHR
ncbi:MAG: cytochrome c3 family protein [Myxococcota bacterium]